jgi:hypothetical protein
VPGPEAQNPGLFIERLKSHTCIGLLQELKKGNRFLIHGDVEWPSFPANTVGSKEAIDTRLKRVIAEFKTRSQVNVDSAYGEVLDDYAARVFKAVRDTNPTTLHVFVLQLVNPKPGPGECQGLARLVGLWERFCAESSPPNILIIFVASASRAEFDAAHGAALAGSRNAAILEEMPNILYNDINSWLRDNRLSTRFNTIEIDKRARALVGPERHEGVQMAILVEEAARWLSDNRIKR